MRLLKIKKTAVLAFVLQSLIGISHADNIIVNTREDEFDANNVNDAECSLREAIFVTNNIYSIPDLTRRKAALKIGFGGCKGEDLANVIELQAPTQVKYAAPVPPYVFRLDSSRGEIKITADVSIQSEETGFFAKEEFENIPTIAAATATATTAARIFNIERPSASSASVVVKISGVNLQGCGWVNNALNTTRKCSDQGGIIRNTGTLNITDSLVRGGVATLGGAIYNDVRQTELVSGGRVALEYVEMAGNASFTSGTILGKGAAIYSAYSNITISKSLLRDNQGRMSVPSTIIPNTIDAVVYIDPQVQSPEAITAFGVAPTSKITNTTFTNNQTAFVLNVVTGVKVNNATLINNDLGVFFDSVDNAATVTNSILFDKQNACFFTATDATIAHNNAFVQNKGCQFARPIDQAGNSGQIGVQVPAAVTLVADVNPADGKCDLAGESGLLCPLFKDASSPIYYFRPRLLMSYTNLAQSPIINKGQGRLASNPNGKVVCETDDLRDDFLDRTECEVGAIELRVGNTNSLTKSSKVLYGETARIELLDILGDGQLIPDGNCQLYFGAVPPDTGNPATNALGVATTSWLDGCIRVNLAPKHGYFYIDQASNELVYVPRRNYHGFEDIQFYVTTTTSRFSDSPTERSLLVRVRVVIDPNTVFEGSTLNLGSWPLPWLAALLLLVCARRIGRKQ